MLVQHWMTRDVVSVEADTPFLEARLILKEKNMKGELVVIRLSDFQDLFGEIKGL